MHAGEELIEVLEALRLAMAARQDNLVDELKSEAIMAVPTYGTWTYEIGGASYGFFIGPDRRGRVRVMKVHVDGQGLGLGGRTPMKGMPLREVATAMSLTLDQAEEVMRKQGVSVHGYGSARWVNRGRATRAFRRQLGLGESSVPGSTLFTDRNTDRSADGTAENQEDGGEATT